MSADERLTQAITEVVNDAEAETDPDAAYRRASWLVDTLAAATTACGRLRAQAARRIQDAEGLSMTQLAERLGVSRQRAADMLRITAARQPEPPPVVAAIVTSALGVLAGKRNDGTPPWTFIAGKIQPGESAADAAVREVKEETGLDIAPGRMLGRRVHPSTGVTMVYMAARPVPGADPASVIVGDPAELGEVRWLTLAEVDELMPGVFDPVRAYLARDHRRQER